MQRDSTALWEEYRQGLDYQKKMRFHQDFPVFVDFKEGRQWPAPTERTRTLPRPVLNMIDMIVRSKRASVLDQPVSIVYKPGEAPDDPVRRQMHVDAAGNLTEYARRIWNEMDMDALNSDAVDDAATNGTGIWYFYWDSTVKGGGEHAYIGELRGEVIDALNFFVANPQVSSVQKQDYILFAQRVRTKDVKRMAKEEGLSGEQIGLICSDSDTSEEAYPAARQEMDGEENGKITLLTRFYRRDGEVVFDRGTRSVEIIRGRALTPDGSPRRITLYPVACMSWKKRKKCFYGIGEVEGLIPNQKLVNFTLGMQGFAVQQMGFPKVLTRPGALRQPLTNEPGEVVTDYVGNGISYLNPPAFSAAAGNLSDTIIQLTRVMTGTTEVVTGEALGANMAASAIIALQNQAKTPVGEIQRRYWRVMREVGRIWKEFFLTYCSMPRAVMVEEGAEVTGRVFTGTEYAGYEFDLSVDVGASSEYSAVLAQATLDKMLDRGDITIDQYIELSDPNVAPFKEKFKKMREEAVQQLPGQPAGMQQSVPSAQGGLREEAVQSPGGGAGGIQLPEIPAAPTPMDLYRGG